MNIPSRNLAVTLILFAFISVSFASLGDDDLSFREHVRQCVVERCPGDPLPLYLRLLRWTCEDNCNYEAMWMHVEERIQRGLPVVQYFGKWPFIRVFGIQEIASVLFSIANGYLHYRGYLKYKAAVPKTYRLRKIWLGYAFVSMNTWLWSSVFHTRDSWTTQLLDYYSATSVSLYSNFATIVRFSGMTNSVHITALAVAFLSFFLGYTFYFTFVHFNFQLNMLINVVVFLGFLGSWNIWFAVTRRKHGWKFVRLTLLMITLASLELGDFAPILFLVDAHALWHLGTCIIVVLFYDFLIADAMEECRRYKSV